MHRSDSDSPVEPAFGRRDRFATTRWSLVRAAAGSATEAGNALEELCRTYWYPLYAYARRRGRQSNDAQDLTQGFVASLLEKQTIQRADPERGRFRSFLLGSFRRYLSDDHRRESTQKRGGDQTILSIDAASAEQRYQLEPACSVTPEKMFDRRWALTLLDSAVTQLQAEYSRTGRLELFEALRRHMGTDETAAPYPQIAADLNMEPGAVKTAAYRLRRRYRSILRSEILQTVASSDDLDAELRHLFQVLGGH